jgi:cell division protein FtsI (penicillin-binding protein 3)
MSRRPRTHVPRSVPSLQLRQSLLAVRRFRMNFLFGALLLLFAILLGRLGQLQIVDGAVYQAEAERKHNSTYHVAAQRGLILDRNGVTLATAKPARRLGLDPTQIQDARTFSLVLSDFLGGELRPHEVQAVLDEAAIWARENQRPLPQYRVLLRWTDDPKLVDRIDEMSALSIRQKRRAGIYGVVVHREEGRHYPNGDYAAHVLGQMPREDAPGTGIEHALDEPLSGQDQSIRVRRDGRRRPYAAVGRAETGRTRGLDARLTIDITIQHHLEQALNDLCGIWAPTQACGIVLDPHSGEILAMANRPTFDPNRQVANANLAVQGLYEPGSFFKPFTVAWALRHGVVGPDEEIDMPSSRLFQSEKKAIRDVHYVGPGTVRLLISASSNTGAAELADRLGQTRMRDLFEFLYPNREGGTRCGLPYEKQGGPRRAEWPWWFAHRAAFGQSFHITPLQMAASFAAFARDDARIVQPTIFLGRNPAQVAGPQLCSRAHLAVVREGLVRCVEEGTARGAFAGAGYTAAAKTATAEQWGQLDGAPCRFNNCSLAAYAPAEDPQVVVLLLAQLPETQRGFGGTVAGPHLAKLMGAILRYWQVGVPAAERGVLALAEGGTR